MSKRRAVQLILTLLLVGTIIGTVYGAFLTYKAYVEIYGEMYPLGEIEMEIGPMADIEGLEAREDYLGEIRVWTYSNDTEFILQLAQVSQIVYNFREFTVKICLPLDMIFVVDTTGSMAPYMDKVKEQLTVLVNILPRTYKAPLRFGVVGFKDYPGETTQLSLTNNYAKVLNAINNLEALDGGAIPQSHYLGLQAALNDFTTNSVVVNERVVVFISDAEAGKGNSPSFDEAQAIADLMGELGIKIFAVLCGPDEPPEFDQLNYYAAITWGEFIGPEGQRLIFNGVTGHPTWIVKITAVTPFDSFQLRLNSSAPCKKAGYYKFYVYVSFYAKAIPWHEWFAVELMASLEKGMRRVIYKPEPTLKLIGSKGWYWVNDTSVSSVAVGNVDGDASVEIVAGGDFYDGTRYVAQLDVWDGATLTVEHVTTWYWFGDTHINSVAIGDVDGDGSVEIVTGGNYHDGTRDVAQLAVWDGSTLSVEGVTSWYWFGDTHVNSVATGDVDGDGSVEIVTGGNYFDGVRYIAQLVVWNGQTLSPESVAAWYWTADTSVSSVAVGNVDGDASVEIVTGGDFYDGVRYVAQLAVWNGATLSPERVTTWYWTADTHVDSLAIGDVDGDSWVEIVTGGSYFDGASDVAQLAVWSGSTLSVEKVVVRPHDGDAYIYSVPVGDVDDDDSIEIVSGGNYYDGTRDCAELVTLRGSDLAFKLGSVWYWSGDTHINSVAVGDVDGDGILEIVAGGDYHDGTRMVAQLTVWHIS